MRLATVELREVLEEVVSAPGKVELNPNRVSRVLMRWRAESGRSWWDWATP